MVGGVMVVRRATVFLRTLGTRRLASVELMFYTAFGFGRGSEHLQVRTAARRCGS